MQEIEVTIVNHLKKFNILFIKNLAEYYEQPVNAIRKDLRKYRKDVFADNERIIFYIFQDLNPKIIDYLYNQCLEIDFPDFFINIVSNDVINSCPFTQYNIALDSKIKTITETTNFNLPHTLCIAPWINAEINIKGEVRPCCKYEYSCGSVLEKNLQSIFNNQTFKKLRQDLLNGEKPLGCKSCWKNEKFNITSHRQIYNQKFSHDVDDVDFNNSESQTSKLDIKTSYICNLKCRICNHNSSSYWLSEVRNNIEKFPEINQLEIKSNLTPWVKNLDSNFWESFRNNANNLTYITFAGGEPFMDKSHTKILQHLIDSRFAKNITLHYNTNGTVDFSDLFEMLDRFKSVEITFSIDNIGESFEYERYGVSWNTTNANIRKIINSRPNYHYGIWQTVSIFNVDALLLIKNYADLHNISYQYNLLDDPSEFCIDNMPPLAKKYIIEKFNKEELYSKIIQRINNDNNNYNKEKFWKTINKIDNIRNQSFSQVYPIANFF